MGLMILIGFLLVPLILSLVFKEIQREKRSDIYNAQEDGYFRRFPGGIIEYYRNEYDLHRIVNAPADVSNPKDLRFEFLEIWGIRKSLIYKIPLFHDPVPLYNYFMEEFTNAGFEIIYSVYGESNMGRPGEWFRQLFQTSKNPITWKDLTFIMDGDIHCYISGKKKNGKKYCYASLFAVNHYRNNKNTGVFIFITENPD